MPYELLACMMHDLLFLSCVFTHVVPDITFCSCRAGISYLEKEEVRVLLRQVSFTVSIILV